MSCRPDQISLQETILLTPRNTMTPVTNGDKTTWTHNKPGNKTHQFIHKVLPPFLSTPWLVSYFGSPDASPIWSQGLWTGGLFWRHGHLQLQWLISLWDVVLLFIVVSAEPSKACHPEDTKWQWREENILLSYWTAATNGIMWSCNQTLLAPNRISINMSILCKYFMS